MVVFTSYVLFYFNVCSHLCHQMAEIQQSYFSLGSEEFLSKIQRELYKEDQAIQVCAQIPGDTPVHG